MDCNLPVHTACSMDESNVFHHHSILEFISEDPQNSAPVWERCLSSYISSLLFSTWLSASSKSVRNTIVQALLDCPTCCCLNRVEVLNVVLVSYETLDSKQKKQMLRILKRCFVIPASSNLSCMFCRPTDVSAEDSHGGSNFYLKLNYQDCASCYGKLFHEINGLDFAELTETIAKFYATLPVELRHEFMGHSILPIFDSVYENKAMKRTSGDLPSLER